MMRYLSLLRMFMGNAVRTETEYRADFFAHTLISLFWLAWAGLSIGVFYRFTDTVAGWTYSELLVVIGLFFCVNGLRQAVIQPNLSEMSSYVQQGTLDFLLLKPVNSQFMVSFRHLNVHAVVDVVVGLAVALIAAGAAGTLGVAEFFTFAWLIAIGAVALYGVSLLLHSLTVWVVTSIGIEHLLQAALETGRFPNAFYHASIRLVLTVIVPVALMTTIPAEALLGRAGLGEILFATAVALGFVALGSLTWKRALISYTSAGG
jgi:ABC-2 type transport system permease protein